MQNEVVKAAVVLDFYTHTQFFQCYSDLCHLMSDSHYNPNETVNSPITGMEMSIITQPKVATEEIVYGSPRSVANLKDMATFKSSQGGSQHRSHNVPK